jgi:hypothetical protein
MRKSIKTIIIIFALLTLVFTGASRPLSGQLQQSSIVLQITQVDTSEFPLILVYVSVRDAKGKWRGSQCPGYQRIDRRQ